MDRSYPSPLPSLTRSPFSPRTRPTLNTSKRTSLLPGFKKSSRFSVSGKSNQSIQVIAKTPYHTVECFGSPLPVIITEALTFVERNTVVSAQISECGYAWVVCGRRLLIWQYRQLAPEFRNSSQCYELTLPQSDLVHRADLVCVIVSESPSSPAPPACLAVSPEGLVRYWPSISHEGVSVEQCIELQGQECDSVTYVNNIGCVLATTTCSVVLLTPNRRTIVCHTLKPPAGWLGGISRKLTSFIFGPMSNTQVTETRLVKVATSLEGDEWSVYVLAGHSLQRWSLETTKGYGGEHFTYECDVGRLAREAFHAALWETGASADTPSDTDVWLLDMQIQRPSEIVLLAAAVNTQRSPQMHYAIVSIPVGGAAPPKILHSFTMLKISGLYREDNEADVLSYRLLLCGNSAYIYSQRAIIALGVVPPASDDPDTIEFTHAGDHLLGGSVCVNSPLFFTRNHGLITLTTNEFNFHDNLNSSIAMSDVGATPNTSIAEMSMSESNIGNLTLYDLDPHEVSVLQTNNVGQLKAAFIYHLKKSYFNCEKLIADIFPITGSDDVDAPLDKAIVIVGKELVNDIPAGDPRWIEQKSQSASLGSSTSMQIIRQLHDKQQALNLLISFLKETKLWDRMSKVTIRGMIMPTSYILAEHAEKLVAAIAIKTLHINHTDLVERAIKASLQDEGSQLQSGNLTAQDLFYRNVTQVHRLLQQLALICTQQSHSDLGPLPLANLISESNVIILHVLQEVVAFRQKKAEMFATQKSNQCEYLPWTAALGTEGLRDTLFTMNKLTLTHGARVVTSDVSFTNILYEQLVNLVDILLDGKKCHLDSVRGSNKFNILLQQYETERANLIQPLYDDRQYERAAILAEKYCDFQILVMICEATNNQTRLNEYMDRFAVHNFSEYVFNWYLRENKQGRLITKSRVAPSKQNPALATLLGEYPSLSWLQNIFIGNHGQASEVLYALSRDEMEYVTRKKSMLSLAKLAQLAAPNTNPNFIQDVNAQLDLIAHQEDMPDAIMAEHGYDVKNPRVLSPTELIHLYINPENESATEFEFKKALDLLDYVTDELERSDLAHKIWCAIILRDETLWKNLDTNTAEHSVLETIFFQVIDIAILMGRNVDQFVPSLDRLLEAPELSSLNQDANFQYLMKSGYEHIYRTYKRE